MKYLKFNTCVERDPVAQRAVDAVVRATEDCLRARNNLWIQTMLLEAIFERSEYAPNDYWAFPVDLNLLTFDCKTCCGRLFVQNEDEEEIVRPPVPPKLNKRLLTVDINDITVSRKNLAG